MFKWLLYVCCCLTINTSINGQINLVPNYSFEDKLGNICSFQMGIPQPTSSVFFTKYWYSSSTFGTPDYFNICANGFSGNPPPNSSSIPTNCKGYQQPRTGNAYAGCGIYVVNTPSDSVHIITEPFSVKLQDTLKKGHCYYGEFYVSLGNISDIGINQISMLLTIPTFTTASFSYTNTIQPQIQWDTTKYFIDTLNWVKISGTFVAQGGEQYLTIGNFKDGAHTKKTFISSWAYPTNCSIPTNPHASYIYVDDVSLYELPIPQLQSSYTLCPASDSLVIGDTARVQTRYQWYANGLAIDTTSYITIKPSQTTTYVLHTTNCSSSTQTVVVTYSTNCESIVIIEPTIPNVFTPNGDGVNDVWSFELKNMTGVSYNLYNRWGLEVASNPSPSGRLGGASWDGCTTSGEACNEGVYFYTLQYTDANGDVHKKNGYVTLIK